MNDWKIVYQILCACINWRAYLQNVQASIDFTGIPNTYLDCLLDCIHLTIPWIQHLGVLSSNLCPS